MTTEAQRLNKPQSRGPTPTSSLPEYSAPGTVSAGPPGPAWAAAPAGLPFALAGVQRKVAIGESNDIYERQADQVASHVAGGRQVPPSMITPISGALGALGQRQAKPEEKKKEEKPAATPPVQKQAKPEEKKKKEEKPAAAAPVQKQSKPEDKKKEAKAATPPPVQKQARPEEKKSKEEKPSAAAPVQKQSKPEDKKKEVKPAAAPPVQKQTKPEDKKKKEEKPSVAAPVQKQSKPEERKKDEKPATPPVQRETRPEDEKKGSDTGPQPVQRAASDKDAADRKDEPVQTSRGGAGGASGPSMESAAARAISSKGPGEPLNSATRSTLESRMGTELSDVRVHNDSAAQESASALNARAFTYQNDIWLGRGESQSDTRLMAHEATHVVQQTGSLHRQLVQREKSPDSSKETSPGTSAGAVGDIKTGLLDPGASSITFEQIEIPAFKAAAHRGKKYAERDKLIRKRDYKRGNPNQRDKWRDKIDTTVIKKQLTGKAKPTKEGIPNATKEYVFKVPTRTGGKPFLIGEIDDVAKQLTIPYWGGKSKTPETKLFDVDHIVELQLANWDADTSANELPNMELLEMSANRSSGGMIANAINKKVDAFLAKNKDVVPGIASDKDPKKKGDDKGGREQVKLKYDLVFQKAVGVGGPSVGSTDFWTQDQVEKGAHLDPVEASSLDEIGGKGRVLVFSGPGGGLGKTFSWKEADKDKSSAPEDREAEWLKPFTIQSKSFNTSGEGVEKTPTFGALVISIPDGNKKYKPYSPEEITVNRIPGARYAGYLNKNQVRSKAEKIEKTGASPIRIDQFDILPDKGIYVAGQILPDLSIIKGAGLDFELQGDELRIFKTFKMEEFKVPKPLSVTNSSLTVSFSTEAGFGIDGEVNFGIDRVGDGYLRGGANKKGFNLAGGFSFDSKLFDPAKVDMKYESEKDALSISGELGIQEGKVRGLKSANFKVSYEEAVLRASGTVKPNIPVVEQGDISLTYSEKDGLVLAGSLELKKDLPGISGGSIHAEVSKKPGADRYIVKAGGEATPKIPGISSKLVVSYDDGAFDASVTASYEKGMLKGSVTVGATNRPVDDSGKPGDAPTAKADKITVYGGGSVTLKLAPWLQATAAIKFKPNGEVEVTGKIGLPSVLNIFDEKKVEKNIFKIALDIPILGFSVLGHNVGIFLEIGGGLDLSAGIGPGQLQEVELSVTYNPAHEEDTEVHGHAALHIPAHAGLRMFVSAALGAGIPIVDAKAGLELGGSLGIEGALHAAVDVDWSPKKGLVLDASAEVYAEPKFKFDIKGFVLVELDLLFTTKTLYEKDWKLKEVEYGSGLRFGLKLPIHYEEGKPFNVSLSDIQFEVPDIDAMSVIKGLFDKVV